MTCCMASSAVSRFAGRQRGVAAAHGLVQRGQGLRHVEVIVHGVGEGLGDLEVVHVDGEVVRGANPVDAGQGVGDETVDALDRRRRPPARESGR